MSTNNYLGQNQPGVANHLARRTVENSVPYIIPVLDALPANFTLLDVGCGPGSITIDIARRYPSSTVLGVDSPDAIETARSNAQEAGVHNVKFAVGDALELGKAAENPGFEVVKGGCDVVHTHQVHMHVQDAAKFMRELREAAKPHGGKVCCREVDLGMVAFWPEMPPMIKFNSVIPKMMQARNQDPHVGRKLLSHALAAGFKRENIEVSLGHWIYSTPPERESWAAMFIENLSNQASLANIEETQTQYNIEKMDMSEVLESWQKWVKAEDGWYAMPSSQVVCERKD
ncbi:methyltransferase domain-containing protein [Pseudomassariella vexata]|uniref:Methyltransferase domain-containing protein n=1 Tax=Pseudomassariella vexata TaxID=1141098 RepID=A0A1Y2DRG0_9PEZI|nr:methyltransferase domain-containing protein [Pseudomassariella vexata]ORY61686.1 methyltransferase domain-containing protein [Pseudomassariella vexata]